MDTGGGRVKGLTVVVVLLLSSIVSQDRVLGQQLPCPQYSRRPWNCCSCQDTSLLCQTTCPARHTVTSSLPVCQPVVTTTVPVPVTPSTTDDSSTSPSVAPSMSTTMFAPTSTSTFTPTTTTLAPQLVRCVPCHVTCKTCNGTRPEDCESCADDHEVRQVNGVSTCVKKEPSSGANVGAIVGGTIAALVAVAVVVVVVVVLYRRRRRMNMGGCGMPKRSISTLMGSGTASPAQDNGRDTEMGERAISAEKTSKVQSLKEATYANVQTTVPNTEDIQQGHDNVSRYTRDPTIKGTTGQGQGQPSKAKKKSTSAAASEDEELADLPEAPVPPAQETALTPPQPAYEIVNNPFSKPTTKPKPAAKPPAPSPTLQPPAEGYEVMDFPGQSSSSTLPSDPQKTRAKTGLLQTPGSSGKGGQKRKTTAGVPASSFSPSSLPNPRAPVSCPDLPKFPSEEYVEKKKLMEQHRLNNPSPPPYVDLDEPEDDYVNVNKNKTAEDQPSEPEDDYQNTGPKKKLVPQPAPEKSSGVVNPAAEFLEEPQGVYGNQNVVDEVDRRSSNRSVTPAQGKAGETEQERSGVNNVTEQPTYGNEVSDDDDDDPAYQNCPKPKRHP